SFHTKVVRSCERDLTPYAQEIAHLVFCFFHHPGLAYREHVDIVGVWLEFFCNRERKIDYVVLIVAATADKELLAFLQHADNTKLIGADFYLLADCRAIREEIVSHLRADDADVLAVVTFKLREET